MRRAIAGIDIGGSKLAAGIVDDSGRVIVRRECATEPSKGPASGLDRMARMLRDAAREAGAAVAGIGIGSTGPVDPIRGTIGKADTLPSWEGTNLIQWFSNEFQVRVALENDADAAALGEALVGAGRGEPVFVYVTISTGIGTGVVLNGNLYRGVDGAHPEIGHLVVEASGPMCYCGARGCWEAVASGPSLATWAAARGLSDPDGGELSAERVCALAAQGNLVAREAVDREGYYIGVGLANLISSFCPGTIALGGGVMKSASLFMDRVREVIRTNCSLVPFEKAKLVMASLGTDAGLVGAWRAWHHHFQP